MPLEALSVMNITSAHGRIPDICHIPWKDTMLYGILASKCPYCREGDFFISHH